MEYSDYNLERVILPARCHKENMIKLSGFHRLAGQRAKQEPPDTCQDPCKAHYWNRHWLKAPTSSSSSSLEI